LFNIGRVLNFAAAAFLPVAFYVVYRQFTATPPNPFILALLLVIPLSTTVLALTNTWHGLIWTVAETDTGLKYSRTTDSLWFARVHAPYSYGLFGLAAIALMSRLSNIAPWWFAHCCLSRSVSRTTSSVSVLPTFHTRREASWPCCP
jgi:hypothetical protein